MKIEEIIEKGSCINAMNKLQWYRHQMLNNNGMLGIKSHYPELDKHTSGIIPGKVYTIAAYSNTGKSRFAYGYINHFLDMGKRVLFFNLEVDTGMCLLNLSCNRYNLYSSEIKDKIDMIDFQNLIMFDNIYNLNDIKQISEIVKPDFIFIDFVQNIQTPGISGYESMATIARSIQQIAISTNATAFSLSQLANSTAKAVTDGDTDFISLKGAGEFVASSDVIFLLRMVDGKIGVTIAKTKYAQKPKNELLFVPDFGRSKFKFLDPKPF